MSEPVFGRVTAAVIVAVVGASFLAWVLVTSQNGGDDPSGDLGPNGYDRTSVGHVALVRLLEELDVPVLQSWHDSGRRAGEDGVLLVVEPTLDWGGQRTAAFQKMLGQAGHVLIVLPKWKEGRGWAAAGQGRLDLLPLDEVRHVLASSGVQGDVQRVPEMPEAWRRGPAERTPDLGHAPVQALVEGEGNALVGTPDRGLVLESHVRRKHVVVITDPDLLSNAGLHRAPNATLVLEAIERLREGHRPLVVDETLHGYERSPSLTRELLAPPLVFSLGHLAAVLLALAWVAGARFGSPVPRDLGFEPGVAGLVKTTAELLRQAGHVRTVLPRYLSGVLEHVRGALHGPSSLDDAALETWLDAAGTARGASDRIADLKYVVAQAAASPASGAAALAAALRIDTWRQEVLDGTIGHPRAA